MHYLNFAYIEVVDLHYILFAWLCIALSVSGDGMMCGDENCDLYTMENLLHTSSRIAPPDDGWSVQGEGMIPPGSLNVHSKREMFGGNMYGAFGPEGTEQRLQTEETVAFAYREVPSETGRVFSSPNVVGPPTDGHFLLFNWHSIPQNDRKVFNGNTDLMFSSSGLSNFDQSVQLSSDLLQDSVRERQSAWAGINPVTGIDLSDGDDSAPGFIGNLL